MKKDELLPTGGYSDLYPKDYSRFKDLCFNKISSLGNSLGTLKETMHSQNQDYADLISRLDHDKE